MKILPIFSISILIQDIDSIKFTISRITTIKIAGNSPP